MKLKSGHLELRFSEQVEILSYGDPRDFGTYTETKFK